MFELPSVYKPIQAVLRSKYFSLAWRAVHRIPDLQRVRLTVKMINIFMISILLIGACETTAGEIHYLKPALVAKRGVLARVIVANRRPLDRLRPTGWRFRDSN
jgi:hypothetical protein